MSSQQGTLEEQSPGCWPQGAFLLPVIHSQPTTHLP